MATVYVTFFLIVQFYVCKMEDDTEDRLMKISRRDTRWSMNSQRLEEIVAELMKPISDVRRNFDTDLSALLEEYLTEAGLHALEQSEESDPSPTEPNFAEIALLLQQSANIYSRKVDFLYQHVLSVSDSLNNSIAEETVHEDAEQVPSSSANRRRTRGQAGPEEFEPIALEPSSSARRDCAGLRPPPTLPRMYIELEPRQLTDADVQLQDAAGEPIGVLADFHVGWRLQGGFLVEELESTEYRGGPQLLEQLRSPPPAVPPLTLPQLAATPPPPSPLLPPSPFNCSTPLPPAKRERKRRCDALPDLCGAAKLLVCEEVLIKLSSCDTFSEFSVPQRWVRRVVERRSGAVLAARLRARTHGDHAEFKGFDISNGSDVGGFVGWAAAVRGATAAELRRLRPDDSDDDGFFELSSYSDEHAPSPPAPPAPAPVGVPVDAPVDAHNISSLNENPEWYLWRESVLARSSEAAPDVQLTAARLLRRLRPAAPSPSPSTPQPRANHVDELLRAENEQHGTHPAHLTLAALFLANSGNIEIIQGEPLTINSFHMRLLSDDESLLRPAAIAEFS
ncbi:uncharacterized protein LOC123697074 [Colias croceus]|uniref:uncharacterized protein LOC123697074 n=1 Tax=Colias crocea TaxID=72248 RepID=UPI001E27E7BA|nr:uncharacterized protein LOC123697074 [Colias croceus]